jgi:hypothetical protein
MVRVSSAALQKKVTQVASMEPVILSEAKDLILQEMLRSAQHDTVGFAASRVWVTRH